jgi:hypothetical protein
LDEGGLPLLDSDRAVVTRREWVPGNYVLKSPLEDKDLLQNHGFLVRRELMRDIWAPIDVVDASLWEEKGNENKWFMMAMVASRMLTYAKYRMDTIYKGKTLPITEQTRMYKPCGRYWIKI